MPIFLYFLSFWFWLLKMCIIGIFLLVHVRVSHCGMCEIIQFFYFDDGKTNCLIICEALSLQRRVHKTHSRRVHSSSYIAACSPCGKCWNTRRCVRLQGSFADEDKCARKKRVQFAFMILYILVRHSHQFYMGNWWEYSAL